MEKKMFMGNNYLIVIDMQEDFVRGSLGSEQARAIIPRVNEKIQLYHANRDKVIFTRDTHFDDYKYTLEGKMLPISHCVSGSSGWEIIKELETEESDYFINKLSFGLSNWRDFINEPDEIEICGVCTDICVISNALILRALFPNVKIVVDSKACAGTTISLHTAALNVMKSCQIEVI